MQNQVHTQSAMHPTSAAGGPMSNAEPLQASSGGAYRGSELASDLLTRLFRRLPMGLTLRLWNGATVRVEPIPARKSRLSSWCFAIPR